MNGKEQWLLCAPKHFDVRYEINPWMNTQRVPDKQLAQKQWNKLVSEFSQLPVELVFVEQGSDWPDMVFTANAGLAHNNKVVLATFRHQERKGEAELFERWLKTQGYEVLRLKEGSFEGEGDALFAGQKLFCGYGFRSDLNVYRDIAALLGIREVIACHLINPSFYHLDTCFCPLNEDEAIYVPSAFDPESIERMGKHISLIAISDDDAARFACNAVVVGKDIILPAGCTSTEKILTEKGYRVHSVEMSEFMKAGGAAKCLSLRLSHQ